MAVRPIKLTNIRQFREIENADDTILTSIVNAGTSGTTGEVYGSSDSQTTTVNLATGSAVSTVNLANSSSATNLNGDNIVLTAATDISLTAATDINFSGLGSSATQFNEAGDLILNSNFSSAGITSLIGALNALQDGRVPVPGGGGGSSSTVVVSYIAGEAISAGEAVRIPLGVADTVRLTDADVISESNFIGIAAANIAASSTGNIIVNGVGNAILVTGLTLGTGTGEVAAGQELFLSLTSGSLTTDVSSFTAGDTILSVGYIKDPLTYNGSSDLEVEMQIRVGVRAVLS